MAGQPQDSFLWFDVKDLQVSEPGTEVPPPNVIDYYNPFYLQVTLEGHGPGWGNMCGIGGVGGRWPYKVSFYAEGFGGAASEIDFAPPVTGNLTPADYGAPLIVQSPPLKIADTGIYRVTCMVEFPGHFGVLGFPTDDLVIQVSTWAEVT